MRGVGIPGKALGEHRGFDRIEAQTLGMAAGAQGIHCSRAISSSTLQGNIWPRRHLAWRPRRIR